MLLLYAIAAGLFIGRLLGGRLRNLEHVRIEWWRLALGGLLVQIILFAPPVAERIGPAGPAIYVASTLVVLAALLRNVRHPGLAVIAVGAALNLVAILVNGGSMPADPNGWLALTGTAAVPFEHYSNSVLIGPDTLFPFLGDIFVWPRPLPFANVFSIGDVVIAVGAIVFLVAAMRTPGRAPSVGRVPGFDHTTAPRRGRPLLPSRSGPVVPD